MNSLISRINLSNFFFLFSSIWTRWFIWTFFYILQEKSQGLSFFAVGPTYSTYIWLGITKDRLNVNDGPNGRHDERSFYITQSSPFTMSSSTSHTHTWVEKILNKTVDPSLPLASFDFNFVNQMRILFLLYFWRCSITTPRSFKRIHIRAAKLFFFGGSRVSLRATMTRLSSATKGQRRRSCRIPFGSPQLAVLRQFTQDNDKVTGASCNTTQKIWKRKNKTSGLFLLRLAKLIWVDVVTIVVDKKTKIKFRFFVDLFLDFLFLLWWIGNRKNGAVSKDIPKTLLTFDCRLL